VKPVVEQGGDALLKAPGVEVIAHRVIQFSSLQLQASIVWPHSYGPCSFLRCGGSDPVPPAVVHQPSYPCACCPLCSRTLPFSTGVDQVESVFDAWPLGFRTCGLQYGQQPGLNLCLRAQEPSVWVILIEETEAYMRLVTTGHFFVPVTSRSKASGSCTIW